MTPPLEGPLQDVRVLDLTHVLNGPFCTMLLAHMGADVIKVEHGAGDMFRRSWMPAGADHDGYEFLVVNANKRGVTLNLKSPEGREMFERLVADCDIVVENFSVGVLDRLGLGYDRLTELNDRIIYARSSGYGDDGPYAQMRAFAATIMAISGWTSEAWDAVDLTSGGMGLGIGDEAAGASLALGILAALHARDRTGQAQRVDVSMQEAQLGFMVSSLHGLFEGVKVRVNPAQCADGHVAFYPREFHDERWRRLCEALGHPEGADDPRFASFAARHAHFDELMLAIKEWVAPLTRAQLAEIFLREGLPGAPVLTMAEAIEDPNLTVRGAMTTVPHPDVETLRMLRPWIRFDNFDTAVRSAGPSVGEHNYEVYGELLGLSAARVDELSAEGAI